MATSLAPGGTQSQANTHTTNVQFNSAVASLTGGGFVVTWTSNLQDGNGYGVYGQRYDSAGVKAGSEFLIDSTGAVSQYNPEPVALNDGGFLIIWAEDNASTDTISARRYDSSGTALGSEFTIQTSAPVVSSATTYSMTVLNDGSLVAAYATTGTNAPAKAQRFNVGGTKLGSEFSLNTTTRALNTSPQLSALNNGGFVAVWTGGTGVAGANEIYAQRFDGSGTKVGSEFRVNNVTTGEQTRPEVATLSNGNFVVVWQSAPITGGVGQDSHLAGTYGQVFDVNGTEVGGEFQINSYTLGSQSVPRITALADGGFAIAWQSSPATDVEPQDGSGTTVIVQRYDAAGTRIGGELIVPQTTTGDQTAPAISSQADGGFVLSWTTPDANSTGIGVRLFAASAAAPAINALSPLIMPNAEVAATALVQQDYTGTHPALQQVTQYEFIDLNPLSDSGHFELSGVEKTANVVFSVASSDLDDLVFIGGANPQVDRFQVRASDGTNWSAWDSGSVSTLIPAGSLTAGSEFAVNTYTTQQQQQSSIAVLAGGGFVITWESYLQDGNGYGVYGQLFGADGTKVGSEFLIDSTGQVAQTSVRPIALKDGGFMAFWSETNPVGTPSSMSAKRYDAAGQQIGSEFTVNTSPASGVTSAFETADGTLVAFYSPDGANDPLLAQRFDINGNKIGTEFQVAAAAYSLIATAAINLDDGGFVVAYSRSATAGAQTDVYLQRFDSSGSQVGGPSLVNTFTSYDQAGGRIAKLAGGGFVILWGSAAQVSGPPYPSQDGSGNGVYAQLYDATANKVGSEFRINTTTSGDQQDASVSPLPDGGFFAAWTSVGQDGSGPGIYMQRFDSTGTKVGSETLVPQVTTGDQVRVWLAARADGGFVAAWTGPDANFQGIKARVWSASTVPIDFNLIIGTAGNDTLNGTTEKDRVQGLDGNDLLYGGAEIDWVEGGSGSDTLFGGTGNDTVYGGTGDDVLWYENVGDIIVEAANEGTDEVRTSLSSFSLSMTQIVNGVTYSLEVENLSFVGAGPFTGTGNTLHNLIIGGTGNDTLNGMAGNDTLDGGDGSDQMIGGSGNDRFYVSAGDSVSENLGEGYDEVQTDLSTYTLGNNLEKLLFIGTGPFVGTGNALDNQINGVGGDDSLSGAAGNDVLVGAGGHDTLAGGSGNDTLQGGTGDDQYVIDDVGDLVVESAGQGTDEVRVSSIGSFSLVGLEVEKLENAGTGAFTGTGNAYDNTMRGGSGADTFSGGDGNDTVLGMDGNDRLYGENGNDTLQGGIGNDTLTGGAGADQFWHSSDMVAGADVITDFNYSEGDRMLNIGNYTLSSNGSGDAVLTFSGGSSFTLVGIAPGDVQPTWFL